MKSNVLLSVIVPVYNRPSELDELLTSFEENEFLNLIELLIVEDGSSQTAEHVVRAHIDKLNLRYFVTPNGGPAPARNYAATQANGEWLLFLDSDVTVPPHYLAEVVEQVRGAQEPISAFGGPDKEGEDFTDIQKAISFSMTSLLTTGGIRGAKEKGADRFYPRSYNMLVKKDIFFLVEGFSAMRYGEDLDLSMKIMDAGYKTALASDAWVFHKRRTSWKGFFNQIFESGKARLDLEERHPGTMKLVHMLPSAMLVYGALSLFALGAKKWQPLALLFLYFTAVATEGYRKYKDPQLAALCAYAAVVQHTAYGSGLLTAVFKKYIEDKFSDLYHEIKLIEKPSFMK